MAEHVSKMIYEHYPSDDIHPSAPWNIKCESQVEFQLTIAKKPGGICKEWSKS